MQWESVRGSGGARVTFWWPFVRACAQPLERQVQPLRPPQMHHNHTTQHEVGATDVDVMKFLKFPFSSGTVRNGIVGVYQGTYHTRRIPLVILAHAAPPPPACGSTMASEPNANDLFPAPELVLPESAPLDPLSRRSASSSLVHVVGTLSGRFGLLGPPRSIQYVHR